MRFPCSRASVRSDTRRRPPARFALTRLPSALTSNALATHAFSLVASTSERNYHNVYARAQVLREFVATPVGFGDADQDFTQIVTLLLDIVLGRLIFVRTFRAVG